MSDTLLTVLHMRRLRLTLQAGQREIVIRRLALLRCRPSTSALGAASGTRATMPQSCWRTHATHPAAARTQAPAGAGAVALTHCCGQQATILSIRANAPVDDICAFRLPQAAARLGAKLARSCEALWRCARSAGALLPPDAPPCTAAHQHMRRVYRVNVDSVRVGHDPSGLSDGRITQRRLDKTIALDSSKVLSLVCGLRYGRSGGVCCGFHVRSYLAR